MIEIKLVNDNIIKDILKLDNNIDIENIKENKDTCMVIVEKKDIYGYAYYIKQNEYAIIKEIKLFNNNKSLFDGLLKAILNLADLNLLQYVLVNKPDNYKDIYNNIGFRDYNYNGETDYLCVNIKEYFEKECRCK